MPASSLPPVRILPVRGRAAFAGFRTAPSRRRDGLRVRYLASTDEGVRVAYQIGRHVGPAVERNRIRRRLRAAVRECASDLAPGSYLLTPAPSVRTATFPDLVNTVRDCMSHSETIR